MRIDPATTRTTTRSPRSLFAKSANGFAVLEADRQRLRVSFVGAGGDELYRYELK